MNNKKYSQEISVFHGLYAPEEGTLAGYGAIIESEKFAVPLPDVLSLISSKNRQYKEGRWQVFTPRHFPGDTLYKQLVFALKYEGINLLVLKKLFENISEAEAVKLFSEEPQGQYSRKLWFLYEWLLSKKLKFPDLETGNYVTLVDEKIQYGLTKGEKSKRHRIVNNLPGTKNFCPLIRKTEKLDKYISTEFTKHKENSISDIHKDILQRASAFLLLKDSKASFSIEGETPKSKRAARWGQAIGQAGSNELSKEELIRLQQLVIENDRFVEMGFRKKGGFVGMHDRTSGHPIPDHISARWQDIDELVSGLMATNALLVTSDFDPVLASSIIAFGFVFIHPFEDGNGRIHRYLFHHILAKKGFSKQGIIFPVSASMLDNIDDYREALESCSKPLLDLIEWEKTEDNNIDVLNETIDLYRYFDLTIQTEFLYDCVDDTIRRIIPEEVEYLKNYDELKKNLDDDFDMPDRTVDLLIRLLVQGDGKLSKRARDKEFSMLNDDEILYIEKSFKEIFQHNDNTAGTNT